MGNRLIKSRVRNSSVQLEECLQTVFALDLLAPPDEFYLLSPWIGNWPVLSNRFGEFRPFLPAVGDALGFGDFLNLLAERGTQVRIVTKPDVQGNVDFLSALSSKIGIREDQRLHEKGISTNRYYLRGSMNLTFSGVKLNEESVELSTETENVLSALNESRSYWSDLAQ
jgi:hypothetical protein